MAKSILVETHIELADRLEHPEAKGACICVHTTRWLTDDETEMLRVAVHTLMQTFFQLVIK